MRGDVRKGDIRRKGERTATWEGRIEKDSIGQDRERRGQVRSGQSMAGRGYVRAEQKRR